MAQTDFNEAVVAEAEADSEDNEVAAAAVDVAAEGDEGEVHQVEEDLFNIFEFIKIIFANVYWILKMKRCSKPLSRCTTCLVFHF